MVIEIKGLGRLNKLQKKLGELKIKPSEIVDKGYIIAYNKAPKFPGSSGGGTKRAIQKINFDDKKSILRLKQPVKRQPLRPYHLWMHGLGKYDISKFIKSGEGKFMFSTAEKMQDLIKQEIQKRLEAL